MIVMIRLLFPVLLMSLGGAALSADHRAAPAREAAKDKAELDRRLAGLVADKPEQCVQQTRYRDSTRIGDTILYISTKNDLYRTDTNGGCFGLRRGDAIVTKTYTGQLCRGDILQTVDLVSRIPSGSCTFGAFTHYHKP
jgi:hypothetical protein